MNYEDYVNERLRGWGGETYSDYDEPQNVDGAEYEGGLTRAVKADPGSDPGAADPDDPEAIVAVPGFGFLPR